MELTPEQVRRAVDAYDAERCRVHNQDPTLFGMSERNKQSISPLIEAAIRAAFAEQPQPPR